MDTAASVGNKINSTGEEDAAAVIELSIEETNLLRAKLGLKPLRLTNKEMDADEDAGRTARTAYHKPAENIGEQSMVQKRIEEAKLKRQVQKGMDRFVTEATELEKNSSSLSSALEWAAKMRTDHQQQQQETATTTNHYVEPKDLILGGSSELYDHLNVAHSLQELTGTTKGELKETILTLRDESILDYDEHGMALVGVKDRSDNILENVNLTDDTKARENLRKKRQLELGAGHAGGYAGWDDDEFDELGGIGWNTNEIHGRPTTLNGDHPTTNNKVRRLADLIQEPPINNKDIIEEKQLFASKQSLDLHPSDMSSYLSNRISSDYLSLDQEQDLNLSAAKEEKRRKKLLQKEKKLFKKLKKQDDLLKKKHFRSITEQDEEALISEQLQVTDAEKGSYPQSNSLLDELEATAVDTKASHRGGRIQRRTTREDDDHPADETMSDSNLQKEENSIATRRQKFENAMEKGNLRTKKAFDIQDQPPIDKTNKPTPDEVVSTTMIEDDDSILIAALSKAQRLKKLKEMQQQANSNMDTSTSETIKSSDAAPTVLTSLKSLDTENITSATKSSQGGITFEFNQAREFSHALRSKADSTSKRSISKKSSSSGVTFSSKKVEKSVVSEKDITAFQESGEAADAAMEDIAAAAATDEIPSDDDEIGGFGSTANTKPLDRGLAGTLSLLRATGDITGKNAGKEDLCGRAKDERTYEDYEPLNLKEVVKIDTKSATAKDLEFANREIKLDYRDEHGRLLTRKEAWRHLCYQFHGYSSSYKTEEKRMKQIAQERAERAKQNEMLEKGTLGALKATQKATGKAFILHKKI